MGKKNIRAQYLCFQISLILVIGLFLSPAISTAAQITLIWDPPDTGPVLGYNVYRGPVSRTYDTQIDVGKNTDYTFSDLNPELSYCFAVATYIMYDNSEIESGFSNEKCVQSYTVTTNPSSLQVVVDDVAYTTPDKFLWEAGYSHRLSAPSPQSGSTGVRYVFTNWSDNQRASQTRTVTAPSNSASYTANFNIQYSLTTSVNISQGGTVSPSGTNWYNRNQSVNLLAKPNSGYRFIGWSGDVSGTNTSISITVDGPKTIMANFSIIVEEISVPTTPSGSSSGYTGSSYMFSTSGSSSNLGSSHPVEYQFDLGDGTFSSWGSPSRNSYSQSHAWTDAGTYQVRAQARCKNHPDRVSDWSNALSVSIQGKARIRVTSPNGGENLVVGATHIITWDSAYLNSSGTIYLFYQFDGAWHPITTLSPSNTSFSWTIPRIPAGVTSPAPSGSRRSRQPIAIWIGNWANGGWECFDTSDQTFRILYDAWVCKISGADQGGTTLFFDQDSFEGYGISLKWGMFDIDGNYNVDAQGAMSGAYTIRDFTSGTVLGSGSLTGSVDSSSKKLKLNLTASGGTISISGVRFVSDPAIPGDWTGTLSGSASGTLTSLSIAPYQPGDEIYFYVFEFSGSGTLTGGGSINIEGYLYLTSTTTSSRSNPTNVYGIYEMTVGAIIETGSLTGALSPSAGTISFSMTSENGSKYTLTGQKKP